jgi:hypothetical protein
VFLDFSSKEICIYLNVVNTDTKNELYLRGNQSARKQVFESPRALMTITCIDAMCSVDLELNYSNNVNDKACLVWALGLLLASPYRLFKIE